MLTKRPKEVLDFIRTYASKRGYSPSLEEIRRHFKFASVSTAHFHVSRVEKDVYALRVVGNSMIDENINDGDVVLVRHQETAENGQKVVALIDNHEATLK